MENWTSLRWEERHISIFLQVSEKESKKRSVDSSGSADATYPARRAEEIWCLASSFSARRRSIAACFCCRTRFPSPCRSSWCAIGEKWTKTEEKAYQASKHRSSNPQLDTLIPRVRRRIPHRNQRCANATNRAKLVLSGLLHKLEAFGNRAKLLSN